MCGDLHEFARWCCQYWIRAVRRDVGHFDIVTAPACHEFLFVGTLHVKDGLWTVAGLLDIALA